MNTKPRIQVFLCTLLDEKAAEVARRMPFMKRDFKVAITHLSSAESGEGYFQDSGIPLTGVKVDPLPPDDLMNHLEAFDKMFRKDLPDAAMAALPGPESAAFLMAAKAAGVPLAAAELDDQPLMISCFEELSALYACDLIFPASRVLQRALILALPDLAVRVANLLPHSADTTYIQQTKEDRIRLRQELKVDTELKMITMIAPFEKRWDHDTLLEACALLKQGGHDFILFLVGDGPERRRIAEKVCSLQLQDQVSIVDDPGNHLDILSATDIFALCAHFEGCSVPMTEAMAQGLAIAATDVPGLNDLIRNQRSGRLARVRDPESFAQALIDLLAQEKIRKKLGSVARKCIENRGNLKYFMPPFMRTLKCKIKEQTAAAGQEKTGSRNGNLARQYLKLQKKIRKLWRDPAAEGFSVKQAADLLDGFPLHTQVDLLEKMCSTRVQSSPLPLFVRPLEKVLSDRYYVHTPLLEMKLLEQLATFYVQLGYAEGVQKLIETLEKNVQKELFRYHFNRCRFSGLRAYVRLAQLHEFAGEQDQRDFFRLEMRDFLRPKGTEGDEFFFQQNAAFLENLGEIKLAMKELQKDTLGAVRIAAGAPVASLAPEKKQSKEEPKTKPGAKVPARQDRRVPALEAR